MYNLLIKLGLFILGWLGKKLESGSLNGVVADIKDTVLDWIHDGTEHLNKLKNNPKPKKQKTEKKEQ